MVENGGRVVVTVDGLAGTGKTAIAKALAKRAGFAHLNSGLLYRGLACLASAKGVPFEDEAGVSGLLEAHHLQVHADPEGAVALTIDGAALEADLFAPEASSGASKVAKFQKVRTLLVKSQRDAFRGKSLVAEGRDMGTVVFPDANLKFFVEVTLEIRAKRRHLQMQALKSPGLNIEEVAAQISDRDRRDVERAASPTVPAEDAILIDNSIGTLTEVVDSMYHSMALRGLVKS